MNKTLLHEDKDFFKQSKWLNREIIADLAIISIK
jgi:hypothetical protein